MNQKGIANTLIVVIVLIIILGVGGYFVLQQQKEEAQLVPAQQNVERSLPQNEVINNETLGWETYQNIQFGYEFKYPKEWLVEETDGQVKVILPDTTMDTNVVAGGSMIFVAIDYGEFSEDVNELEELSGFRVTDELKKDIEDNQDGYIAGVPKTTRVDIETDTSYRKVIEFFNGEIFYSINSLYGLQRSIAKEKMDLDSIKADQRNTLLLQEKVISTFKFIE